MTTRTRPEVTEDAKLRAMLEYCLINGSTDGRVPKTKLFKLVYLADFARYYYSGQSISRAIYKNRPHGPVPDALFALVEEMTEYGDLEITQFGKAALHRLNTEPTFKQVLDADDLATLETVCNYWKKRPTREIEAFTHAQRPWAFTKGEEAIPYELILQEDHPYQPA